MEVESENNKMGFMETELRLGLPGNNNINNNNNNNEAKKRGFSETVDLKLNINQDSQIEKKQNLLLHPIRDDDVHQKNLFSGAAVDPAKPPPPKAQVVGWPPVRSYRKNVMLGSSSSSVVEKMSKKSTTDQENSSSSDQMKGGSFVKVSMDGAPYLRKMDLNMYNSYRQLSDGLTNMFSSFKDTNNDTNGNDYVPTYEDKDGDWMLVGDVPWEMFVQSCKRLRIMKGAEATGLAPRAMEKRMKNKS